MSPFPTHSTLEGEGWLREGMASHTAGKAKAVPPSQRAVIRRQPPTCACAVLTRARLEEESKGTKPEGIQA